MEQSPYLGGRDVTAVVLGDSSKDLAGRARFEYLRMVEASRCCRVRNVVCDIYCCIRLPTKTAILYGQVMIVMSHLVCPPPPGRPFNLCAEQGAREYPGTPQIRLQLDEAKSDSDHLVGASPPASRREGHRSQSAQTSHLRNHATACSRAMSAASFSSACGSARNAKPRPHPSYILTSNLSGLSR